MRDPIDIRTSARWATASQLARSVIQLTAMLVLARLLAPSEYGLMALANIAAGVAYSLRDFVTTPAVIRRPALDAAFESAVSRLNLAMGVALTLLVFACARPLADYFEAPELSRVLMWLSPLFLIVSPSMLPQAMLERTGRFRELAIIEVAAALAGAVVAIVMARWGAGVYSLVMQAHVPVWIATACLLALGRQARASPTSTNPSSASPTSTSPTPPRPGDRDAAMRELLRTSVPMTLYAILSQLRANVDSFVIGRLFGAHWLGAYSVASKVALRPVANLADICDRAALPSYSAAQQDMVRLGEMYLRSIRLVAFISFPAMAALWLFRQEFTDLALGQRWADAVPILAWLAPIGALASLDAPATSVLIALGRTRQLSGLTLLATVLVALGLAIGGHFGISPMMCGLLLATLISISVPMAIAGRTLGMGLSAPFVALAPSALLAAISMLVMKMVENLLIDASGLPVSSMPWRIALALSAGIAAHLLLARLLARSTANDLMSLLPGRRRIIGRT